MLTASAVLARFASGELRPSDLMEQILERIEALDPELGAYVEVDAEGARRSAREADRAWARGEASPLCGLPVSIKDIFDLQGKVAGCGNPALGRPVAERDAEAVRWLKERGAVVLGSVHLHELALGITGESLVTPRNPLDPTRLPGGSSSGSAVSVAAGMALASLGTDTGGSVRVPAALCGVVGLKPTFGWMGRGGLAPLAWSMDHVGLIGRTVEDVGLISGFRIGDAPRTVGVITEAFEAADEAVRHELEATLSRLRCRWVSLPDLEEAFGTYGTIVRFEAAAVHRRDVTERPEVFGHDVREMLLAGSALSIDEYVQALDRRARFARSIGELLRRHDCLLTPTTLVVAPPTGAVEVEVDGKKVSVREALIRNTCPFSMVGVPALSVPAGAVAGLPVALQVIGAHGGEGAVLAAGTAVEHAVGQPA